MISFNDIPNNLRVPLTYIEFDNSRAVSGTPAMPYKILLLGQALDNQQGWSEPKPFTRSGEVDAQCGIGSQLGLMLHAALNVNPAVEVWGLAVAAEISAAYVHSLEISGTATNAGTLTVQLGDDTKTISVSEGDSATELNPLLKSALTSMANSPAIIRLNDDKVQAEIKWIDTTAPEITFTASTTAQGLVLSTSHNSAPAVNSDIRNAIDVLGESWWNMIVSPWADTANMQAMKEEMQSRFGPMTMADGMVFTAGKTAPDTNDFLRSHLDTTNCQSPSFVVAAVNAAVAAKSLSIDPARPLQTLALPGIKAVGLSDRDLKSERNIKLHQGLSTTFVDAGGNVCIERQITTYTQNALGAADPSYLDVETLATLAYLRYSVRTRIMLRFPRHKLANDGTLIAPGQAIVTPNIIKGELVALAKEWEEGGLIEEFETFKETLVVERNANDKNRVDVLASPDLVNQFRIFAQQIQFIL